MNQSEKYVNALCGSSPQTFVIIGKKPLYGQYSKLAIALETFNRYLDKDVYCTVNAMDGKGRTTDHLTGLRAIYADYDSGIPTSWDVIPSIIVESSPGKAQAYWLLQPGAAIKEWRGVQKALVYATGGDRAAIDAARILRVPGFMNHKYATKPSVTLLQCEQLVYSLDTLASMYGYLESTTRAASNSAQKSVLEDGTRLKRYRAWLAAAQIPSVGSGNRNGWFYRKAAAGVRDFALPIDTVAECLWDASLAAHGDDAYELDECLEITRNADRSATGVVGSAVATVPRIVME